MTTRTHFIFAATVIFIFSACGASQPRLDAGALLFDAGPPFDAGQPLDGGGAGDGGLAAQRRGLVALGQTTFDTGTFEQTVAFGSATFNDVSPAGCVTFEVDACVATRCRTDGGVTARASAGVLTLTGSDLGPAVDFRAERDGAYELDVAFGASLWSQPGQVLVVSASGGAVPAFSASVVAPTGEITVQAPVCSGESCPLLSRSSPLSVRWTSSAPLERAIVLLWADDGSEVMCETQGGMGALAVPAATLSVFDVGSTVTFGVASSRVSVVAVGDWRIHVVASRTPSEVLPPRLTVGP